MNKRQTTNTMMTRLIFTASLLVFTDYSISDDSLKADFFGTDIPDTGLDKKNAVTVESPAFLPVDKAYQLDISSRAEELVLNWVITEGYFLYGDKFFFRVNGKPVEAVLSAGKVSYDPVFDRDVEKHYVFAEAGLAGDNLPVTSGFELSVDFQGCADSGYCYPPQTRHFLVNGSVVTAVEPSTVNGPLVEASPAGTPTSIVWAKALGMLVFAILGGVILNLMPCVLPVLSLKALSLADSPDDHRIQGWSYTLGVVTTFLLIATVLLLVRAAGQGAGWGFQLQSPGFVTLLILLFFVMGLSLSGYITIGTRWMGMGESLTRGSGLKQSWFTGVLAAFVASPCTAPFMAPALGYAITQPWWLALSIFGGLGFGMALPLLSLGYAPRLSNWLPKPGAWMETFKQALAFPMYLTAIWLLWVLGRQLGSDAVAMVITACLSVVLVFWLGKHFSSMQRLAGIITVILAVLCGWHVSQQTTLVTSEASAGWEPYSESRLQELRREGRAVFVNVTADWCITCLANEKIVFTDKMIAAMKSKDIYLIKGDWTNYDPAITRLLEKYDRGGVPLYLLFPATPGAEAQVLPQILRPAAFRSRINSLQGPFSINLSNHEKVIVFSDFSVTTNAPYRIER